jgi:hypothetical protein
VATITTRVIRNARRRGVKVFTRRQCGIISPVYAWRRRFRRHNPMPSDTAWQHISVTHPTRIKPDARTLHRIGMERFGSGGSYNFAVDMSDGRVASLQALDAKGTHTVNDKGVRGYSHDQNAVSHAICVVGMPGTPLSKRAQRSIVLLLAAMVDEGALTPGFDYNPHSMVAWKDCPCDPTRNRMDEIRAAVRREVKR